MVEDLKKNDDWKDKFQKHVRNSDVSHVKSALMCLSGVRLGVGHLG